MSPITVLRDAPTNSKFQPSQGSCTGGKKRKKNADGEKEDNADGDLPLCWVCAEQPRARPKQLECSECYKDWDNMRKDAKRKGDDDFLQAFLKTATIEQKRRLLFTWKQCRKESPATGKKKNLFPWAAVSRQYTIARQLTHGKGGSLKCYTAFQKHYTQEKGFTPQQAHSHWERRKADPNWRHGQDPEDNRPAQKILKGLCRNVRNLGNAKY